jgi:hypothetical protein
MCGLGLFLLVDSWLRKITSNKPAIGKSTHRLEGEHLQTVKTFINEFAEFVLVFISMVCSMPSVKTFKYQRDE